jgi:hypothetical protein
MRGFALRIQLERGFILVDSGLRVALILVEPA